MTQQPFLAPKATTVAGQVAITANNAVTGGNNRNWVLAIRCAKPRHRFGIAQRIGNRLVRSRLSVGHGQQLLQNLLLKGGTVKSERQIEVLPPMGEVFSQLL